MTTNRRTARLRTVRKMIERREAELKKLRRERDQLVVRLIKDGLTWQEAADLAGFSQPYVKQVLKRDKKRGSRK